MKFIEFCIVVMAVMSIMIFLMSYHSVDTAYNMSVVGYNYDFNGFIIQEKDAIYINGIMGMLAGYFLGFITFLIYVCYREFSKGELL